MTDHLKQRHGKINDYADLRDRIKFINDPTRIKTGMEMEFHLQDMQKPDGVPSMAGDARALQLKERLRNRAIDVDDEIAAHMIETKTDAYGLAELPRLVERIKGMRKTLVREAANLDLKPSPYATLADATLQSALANLIQPTPDNPERGARPRAMMETLKNLGLTDLMPYPLLNSSAQSSTSMSDPEHLYATARRHYYLLPFYFVALNTRPPTFNKNTGEKTNIHSGIAMRVALADRGLVPRSFYMATDGDSLMQNYFDDVFKRPMLCHVDLQDKFHMATCYPGESVQSLKRINMNTYSNYSLSESFDWFSGKRKTIPGTNLTRFENRDIDSGLHNDVTFTIISSLINMDSDCGKDIDHLLESYDYADTPAGRQMLPLDLKRAHRDSRSYMDIPYGTGKMKDFAREFFTTITPYAIKHGIYKDLAAFELICTTGATEARMIDRLCRTQDDVIKQQKSVSYEQLERGTSFGMMYDMGL